MSGVLPYIAFVSMPGGGEWIVILIIGLLIFGRRLPEVARSLGKSVNEFKKGMREFQDSADEVVRDVNKATSEVASEVKDASGVNDYGYQEPTATPYGASQYESPESAVASDAGPHDASTPAEVAPAVVESSAANAVATPAAQDEHTPSAEPEKMP